MSGPLVIAVSGPPGSGKSTLAAALVRRIGRAALVEYDAYDTLAELPPEEVAAWIAAGAPYDAVDASDLVADLQRLRSGRPILDRRTGRRLDPQPVIVLETPFGRAHAAMAPMIDRAAFLDTPPDLALARKVRELVEGTRADPGPGGADGFVAWLDTYLETYERIVRPAIAIQRTRVLPLADLVLTPDQSETEKLERVLDLVAAPRARERVR